MTSGIGVADRSWLHRVVVEHDVVRCTVIAADKHMSLTPVQLRVVPDHWRLASSLSAVRDLLWVRIAILSPSSGGPSFGESQSSTVLHADKKRMSVIDASPVPQR